MDYKSIITENEKRVEELFAEYDPYLGKGSPVPRFHFCLKGDDEVYLPDTMKGEELIQGILQYDSAYDFLMKVLEPPKDRIKIAFESLLATIHDLRLRHDFEFWAATCGTITDKEGNFIKLKCNRAQRIFLGELEDMRTNGIPIRAVLLKARQFGGSTLSVLYQTWIQLFVRENWSNAVVTFVEHQARHIRGMFTRMADNHPRDVMHIQHKPYEGSKNRLIKNRGAICGIGSYEEPENLRTFTFQMLHMSEVASWQATTKRTPEGFVQAIRSTVPKKPDTMIVLESTAKGIGNFFYMEYMAAKYNESDYRAVFIPWFHHEEYFRKIKDYKTFINQMGEREWELWSLGATLEGINWYMSFKKGERYEDWQMCEEFPSTDVEAFQSSGQRIFPVQDVLNTRENCMAPEFVGELRGDSINGKASLRGLRFIDNPRGNFKIWATPDKSINVSNRYLVTVDIGGKHKDADWSVIRVLDRYWMTEGEPPEFVATWRGHIDHDLLAWKAAQIATWYNNALLVVEENSLVKESDGTGHFYTILDNISEEYPNLYTRAPVGNVKEGERGKYGFNTNSKTKKQIVDALIAGARDQSYIERDDMACNEMDTFELKPDRRLGAVSGAHDDYVISSAMAVWVCFDDMEPPKVIELPKKGKKGKGYKRGTIVGEATI